MVSKLRPTKFGSKKSSLVESQVPSPTCSVFELYVLLPGGARSGEGDMMLVVIEECATQLLTCGRESSVNSSSCPMRGRLDTADPETRIYSPTSSALQNTVLRVYIVWLNDKTKERRGVWPRANASREMVKERVDSKSLTVFDRDEASGKV